MVKIIITNLFFEKFYLIHTKIVYIQDTKLSCITFKNNNFCVVLNTMAQWKISKLNKWRKIYFYVIKGGIFL